MPFLLFISLLLPKSQPTVFSASSNQYLATLCDQDTSRIECISSPDPSDAAKFFVTAGQELRAWRIVPSNQQR